MNPPQGSVLVAHEPLLRFVAELFASAGVPTTDAQQVAACLIEADLRGIRSHGVARVSLYLRRLGEGLINPKPNIQIREVAPTAAHLDGDNGLGFVVARRAMAEAVERAGILGISMVAASNSNHFGIAANYLQQALDTGLAAMVLTNAPPVMPVWGGKTPFLGTNPIGLALPGGRVPLVLDMATSTVARGKIRRAASQGDSIPMGWALDENGQPTTDPAAALRGVVLPLGGAKGSGLALMVDALAGVVSGAAFGGTVGNQNTDFSRTQNVGHLFMAFRPDLFLPPDQQGARMDELVARARACPRAEGIDEILMPGEPESRAAEKARQAGLTLTNEDILELNNRARKYGVAPLRPL